MQKTTIIYLRVILLCLFLGSSCFTYGISATASHTLRYKRKQQDTNQYMANVALCWHANTSTLHFSKNKEGAVSAEIIVMLRISTDTGIINEETFVINTPPRQNTEDALLQNVADLYEYPLNPGSYQVELVLLEKAYKDEVFQYSDTFTILPVNGDKPFISGISLLDTFFRTQVNTVYTRNGKLLLPLYSNYLDDKRSLLHYYVEVYEAGRIKEIHPPLRLNSYISWKPYAAPVPGLERSDTVISSDFISYLHDFPIDVLPSGNYYLNTILTDQKNKPIDRQTVFFQRYNTNPRKQEPVATEPVKDSTRNTGSAAEGHILDLTTTFLGKYTSAQVREVLRMLLLIADKDEALAIDGFLRKPDELYSKYFIYNFWEKRDKANPEKAWKAYAERIREVNRLFAGGSRPGYETDRGRIYIQYGKPNDRIQVPNEPGALPYELWQYFTTEKTRRETVFLFYRSGNSVNSFELLHTTVVGEKRNMNWRTLLYPTNTGSSGADRENSQAEQYIGNK